MAAATDCSDDPTAVPHELMTQVAARELILPATLHWQARSSGLKQPACPPAEMRQGILDGVSLIHTETGGDDF